MMRDLLGHVDVMLNKMRNLPRRIGSRPADRRGSGGACTTCSNTESAASSEDTGDITVKIINSKV